MPQMLLIKLNLNWTQNIPFNNITIWDAKNVQTEVV